MTSKTSFYSYMKNDLRHRLWVPALSCVVFFIVIIAVALSSQTLRSAIQGDEFQRIHALDFAESIFAKENFLLTMIAIVGAAICGLEGFSYLFSRKKTDYFHSLPMRREKLFFLRWINGLLFFLAPYILCMVICTMLLGGSGLTSHLYYQRMWIGFLYNLIVFLLIYHTAILAVMLTGQILVAIAGFGVLLIYSLIIQYLIPVYMQVFYRTYDVVHMDILGFMRYLSPASLCAELAAYARPTTWAATIFLAAALAAISFVLYRIRPSEAAANSIVFPISRPIIRILLVIPLSLYIALAFIEMAPEARVFWSIFALAVFGLLIHALIEIIYDFDIRSALHHGKQLLICFFAGLAFLGFFLADPLHLDTRLPAINSVKAVYVDLPLDNQIPYFSEIDLLSQDPLESFDPVATTSYRLEHTGLTGENLPLIYNLIRNGQKAAEEDYGYKELIVANLNVAFRKKNGSMEYRNFELMLPTNRSDLIEVYNTKELRENHFQIESLPSDIYTHLEVTDAAQNVFARDFSEEELAELVDIYKRELLAQTTEDALACPAVGQLDLTAKSGVSLSRYQIYSSFTGTIEWLKEHTIDLNAWTTHLNPVSMTIRPYGDGENGYYNTVTYANGEYIEPELDMAVDDEKVYKEATENPYADTQALTDQVSNQPENQQVFPVTITDPDHIRSLMPHLYNQEMYLFNDILNDSQKTNYAVTISFQDRETDSLSNVDFICPAEYDMARFLAETETLENSQ